MRPYRSFVAKAALLCIFSLLVSCSVVRLGYSNGESLTYWWLHSYVDFNAEQKPWVRQRINGLFKWHRKTQLQDYIKILTQGQQQLRHPVTQADILTEYDELKKRALIVIDHALPDLADLALSLQPQQIASIEKKFAANNDTYRADYLRGDAEARQNLRYKKVMEKAEYWFGSFSSEQEKAIRQLSDARPLNNDLWMGERMQRQQQMIKLLKKVQAEKPSREAVIVLLKAYVAANIDHIGLIDRKDFFETSTNETAAMVAFMINNTTPSQKEKAMKRLQQWVETFKGMESGNT
jgi:Family of unknown function (DUF6279)